MGRLGDGSHRAGSPGLNGGGTAAAVPPGMWGKLSGREEWYEAVVCFQQVKLERVFLAMFLVIRKSLGKSGNSILPGKWSPYHYSCQ